MSDLQCAATLVLAAVGDEEQARVLAEGLQGRRVAVVYTDGSPVTEAVEAVSAGLGAPVRSEPDLREGFVPPGTVLGQLADEHRGETVLVLAEAPVLAAAVREVVPGAGGSFGGRSLVGRGEPAPGERVELRVDADGWVVDSWAGQGPAR